MNFKPEVTIFKNVFEQTGQTVPLSYFLDGSRWKDQVLKVRNASSKKEKAYLKQRVPAATMSGIFKGKNDSDLVYHNGLICLDIDRKENENLGDFNILKIEIGKLPFVAYVGQSISGIQHGLFVLIPILNPSKHKEHFNALQYDFKKVLNVSIDVSCSNVSRLRYVSYEPEPIFNWKAKKYNRLLRDKSKRKSKKVSGGYNLSSTTLLEFNESNFASDIIEQAGWKFLFSRGKWNYYNRPGAAHSNKIDAAIHKGKNFFYVFTDSSIFMPNKCYSPFMIYATLEHGSDFKKALKFISNNKSQLLRT